MEIEDMIDKLNDIAKMREELYCLESDKLKSQYDDDIE